jgi:pyruvate dehydrogenase E1 component
MSSDPDTNIHTRRMRTDGSQVEDREWLESLESVFQREGRQRVGDLLVRLRLRAKELGAVEQLARTTPYTNTIPADRQRPYPGLRKVERQIKSIVRWNAMAMVVRANREDSGIGGHISSFASCATLFEVGFNHFFRGRTGQQEGDIVYFQGHAAPGVYARAFLEGRLSGFDLENFRRELRPEGGLPSYPHPRLMKSFWEFPTVSMGLSPIMAIYQARFSRYLENRGLKPPSDQKIWAFLGDGEMDEPESLGALSVASREGLDNLIFVVNCNLQRLDGPVRGNGKIVQELEAVFAGAGWNVLKVLWGSSWDPLFAADQEGLLAKRLEEVSDGQYQKYVVSSGDYIRRDFFGKDPRLLELVKTYSDEQLEDLRRGGHDPAKVYAAYQAAVEHRGGPSVVLAQTIKGYGLGEAAEGRNITHQQKKLNEQELLAFRTRFGIPISDGEVQEAPFYRPLEETEEMQYLRERRRQLGGFTPHRLVQVKPLQTPPESLFEEFYRGSGKRTEATTMVFVRLLAKLLKDPDLGKLIVPIVPDEARTFGMESLFRQVGIYSAVGQQYEPVDKESLLYYKEQKDGAILEEGITEAGAMSSFIAAGTAYATHRLTMIPFYFFYSIFGMHRTFDLIWAAGDIKARGFLVGGIAGRTTLAGEGLQHCDGHSHLFALAAPHLKAYDPAFGYELAVIVRDGLHRMYEKQEDIYYYITMMNEFYAMPPMPPGVQEGILRGLYRYQPGSAKKTYPRVNLLGSGTILNEAVKAQEMLESKYGVAADVWSVTSYKELYTDAIEAQRWNRLHPKDEPKRCHLQECFAGLDGLFVAASDYVKVLPSMIAPWVPGRLIPLGTDGYGRSDTRAALRDYFEVDWRFITLAALAGLADEGKIKPEKVQKAIKEMDLDPEKVSPLAV